MLFAALAERALRHAERGTDIGDARRRFGDEQILEPGQNVSMAAAGFPFLLCPLRQTFDQRMEQLLLQPVSGLKVGQRSGACLGHPDRSSVEAAQLPDHCRRRTPASHRRNDKPSSIQRAAVLGKLLARHPNGAPMSASGCSGVQSVGDLRRSGVGSRSEPARYSPSAQASGCDAVRAQSRLKILCFTKYRRAAARHSASTPMPEAVPPARGLPAIQAERKRGSALFNYGKCSDSRRATPWSEPVRRAGQKLATRCSSACRR
jgi:hypothetical protein